MNFATRHELAEIKAVTHELDRRSQEVLAELERIKGAYPQLAGQDQRPTSVFGPRTTSPEPARSSPRQPAQRRGVRSIVARVRRTLGRFRPRARDGVPLVAFVHVPKTAGGTVKSMFTSAYSPQQVRDAGNYFRGPEETARGEAAAKIARAGASGRVSIGHVPIDLFQENLPGDTRYMTFLREPVDRVVSHYYRHRPKHARNLGRGGRAVGGKITAASLEHALARPPLPQLSNLATRLLCGHPSPLGDLPASALDDAKENLSEFAFVGIQERFEESLVLLQRMLGLDRVPYENRHVSSDRPAVEEIPDEQRELILEHNQLDAELYTFASGLFDEAVAAADDGFAADVAALRDSSEAGRRAEESPASA